MAVAGAAAGGAGAAAAAPAGWAADIEPPAEAANADAWKKWWTKARPRVIAHLSAAQVDAIPGTSGVRKTDLVAAIKNDVYREPLIQISFGTRFVPQDIVEEHFLARSVYKTLDLRKFDWIYGQGKVRTSATRRKIEGTPRKFAGLN